MARKGKVYLFGDGNQKANPIHGEDLAKVCVSAIESNEKEIEVGGPETLTHNEIAELAFSAVGKKTKVFHIPDFFRRLTLKVGKIFMSSKNFGPMEFFMNVMAIDMVAPKYGNHQLQNFFMDCKDKI
jgi:nucleoside-diphosphate-sugar epimerase